MYGGWGKWVHTYALRGKLADIMWADVCLLLDLRVENIVDTFKEINDFFFLIVLIYIHMYV